ncbi:MAG: hypothetical protein HOK72_13360 [Flavobacteriales bacterium]|jgi:hypothetical protein|nr:hypothetical protein [Flavobacteriales bacterium]
MFSKIFSKKINIHDPNYFELDPILGNKSGIGDGEFKTHSKHFIIRKEIKFPDYKFIFVEYTKQITNFKFIWRMFAFKNDNSEPEYSLNHEVTPFTCCFGMNDGVIHGNIGSTSADLSFKDFFNWAKEKIHAKHKIVLPELGE